MKRIEPGQVDASLPGNLGAYAWQLRDTDGPTCRVVAVGDISLSASSLTSAHPEPFTAVAPFLRTASVSLGNLECVLIDGASEGAHFVAPTAAAQVLKRSGFSHLHLANNHLLDLGSEGLESTLAALEASDIEPLGAGHTPGEARRLVTTSVDGLRVGFLGCGRTGAPQVTTGACLWELDPQALLADVTEARGQVDALVVSLHAGYMYLDVPPPELRNLARSLTAAGADVVVAHHPHVLQGIEIADGGRAICYSLGNFRMDPQEGRSIHRIAEGEQRDGAVFLFELSPEGLIRLVVIPTTISPSLRVDWAVGDDGLRVLERIERTTRSLDTGYERLYREQRARRNTGPGLTTLANHLRSGEVKEVLSLLRRLRFEHLTMLARWVRAKVSRPTSRQ